MRTVSPRRIAVILAIPFVLLLAGCGRLHADYDVRSETEIYLKLDIGVETQYVEDIFNSAKDFCDGLNSEEALAPEGAEIVPYEEDGLYGCRVEGLFEVSNTSDFSLTYENNEYHLQISGDDNELDSSTASEMDAIDTDVTFSFPGKVISSKGGTIDGNSVHYTSYSDLSEGVDIKAEGGGFPWWILVVLAILAIAALIALAAAIGAFFLIRSRRNKTPKPSGVAGGSSGGYPASGASGGYPAAGNSAGYPGGGASGSYPGSGASAGYPGSASGYSAPSASNPAPQNNSSGSCAAPPAPSASEPSYGGSQYGNGQYGSDPHGAGSGQSGYGGGQGYSGPQQGPSGESQWYPSGDQGYPGQNQSYPGGNQGYPGQGNQGYPGQ